MGSKSARKQRRADFGVLTVKVKLKESMIAQSEKAIRIGKNLKIAILEKKTREKKAKEKGWFHWDLAACGTSISGNQFNLRILSQKICICHHSLFLSHY